MTEYVDYEALAARLTDPETEIKPVGLPRTGAEAAAEGQAFLLREYGSEEAIERAMRPGRPAVGHSTGESPTVRGRISHADFAAFKRIEEQTGKRQSELVRDAVHLLLEQYRIGA